MAINPGYRPVTGAIDGRTSTAPEHRRRGVASPRSCTGHSIVRGGPDDALVLLDDLTIEQAQTLFGQLRDELWQTSVDFTVAVRPDVAQALASPPADVFFDRRVTLEPLPAGKPNELLRLRGEAGDSPSVAVFSPEVAMQPRGAVALAEEDRPTGRYDPVRQGGGNGRTTPGRCSWPSSGAVMGSAQATSSSSTPSA